MMIQEKLAAYSAPDESGSGCVLWRNYLSPKGYGRLKVGGRTRGAHQAAWEMAHGPIPRGMQVLHRCDVRHCVNPDHLFLGTQADNLADMVKKGRDRHPNGTAHGRAKLTEQDVYVIRAATGSQQAIADRYGVTQTTVSSIQRRKIWRHLP